MISTWSYSRLATYETCPFRAKLQYVDRIPEPERALPRGKTEHANDRGSRVHDECEGFVRGQRASFPDEARHFRTEFRALRNLFDQGKVSLEGEWGIDEDWAPVSWRSKRIWGRVKLDALAFLSPEHAVVIDYKTGRRFGNEYKHADQGNLYQLATILRYPKLQTLDVEFWYLDQDELTRIRYTRAQGLRFFNGYQRRAQAMTTATQFPARPNVFNCKWCPYGPAGTGHCKRGVQDPEKSPWIV